MSATTSASSASIRSTRSAAMTKFAADRGVTYELLRDPDESLGQALDVVAYPVTLLVAADGTILDASGAMSGEVLRKRIGVLFP